MFIIIHIIYSHFLIIKSLLIVIIIMLSFIYPHLDYVSIIVWKPHLKSERAAIENEYNFIIIYYIYIII